MLAEDAEGANSANLREEPDSILIRKVALQSSLRVNTRVVSSRSKQIVRFVSEQRKQFGGRSTSTSDWSILNSVGEILGSKKV